MARSFSGTDRLDTSANVSTTAGIGYAAAGWTVVTGGSGAIRCIWRNSAGAGGGGLYVNSTNKLSGLLGGSLNDTTFTPTIGTWFHWVMTWASNENVTAIYANGSSVLSGGTGVDTGVSAALRIGADNFSQPLQGNIADFAFWSNTVTAGNDGASISAAQILALSKGVRPYHIPNIAALGGTLSLWYPLDGLQSPEPDLSGNKNNGTLTGTALAFGPPIMQFTPRWPQNIFTGTGAAGPSFQPAWAIRNRIVVEGIGI